MCLSSTQAGAMNKLGKPAWSLLRAGRIDSIYLQSFPHLLRASSPFWKFLLHHGFIAARCWMKGWVKISFRLDQGFFLTSALLTLWTRSFFLRGCCPMHCKMFSCIPGFVSIRYQQHSFRCDNHKCLQILHQMSPGGPNCPGSGPQI